LQGGVDDPLNRKLRVVIKGAEVDIANLRQKEK